MPKIYKVIRIRMEAYEHSIADQSTKEILNPLWEEEVDSWGVYRRWMKPQMSFLPVSSVVESSDDFLFERACPHHHISSIGTDGAALAESDSYSNLSACGVYVWKDQLTTQTGGEKPMSDFWNYGIYLGPVLRLRRERQKISQTEVARRISAELPGRGVDQSYVSAVEGGQKITFDRLCLFAQALGIAPSKIVRAAEVMAKSEGEDEEGQQEMLLAQIESLRRKKEIETNS